MPSDIKANFAHLCEYASLTQNEKLNVLGILDKIITRTVPVKIPLIYYVASFTVPEEGNYKVTIKFLSINDQTSFYNDINVDLSADTQNKNLGIYLDLVNVEFRAFEKYEVLLLINEDEIHRLQFEVTQK